MADTKISGATPYTGTGAASRGTARAGSTTAYRTVDNLNATVDPTATDDSALFYHIGSLWRRSDTREEWYCSDATATAAVWVPRAGQFGSPRYRFYTFTDCVHTGSSTDSWSFQTSGTGAAIGQIAIGSLNALGIYSLDLGTTTTGRCALYSSTNNAAINVQLGKGRARFQAKAAIHTLSNGTDTYSTRIGFYDGLAAESTDGVFFRYTDSVNSGKWQAVTRSNGTETATDTGVTAVADTWQRFEIDVNAAGTSVVFRIDGATVATNTTNIPTGTGRDFGYGAMSLKSAGTTATSGGYFDWLEVEYLFTTVR